MIERLKTMKVDVVITTDNSVMSIHASDPGGRGTKGDVYNG